MLHAPLEQRLVAGRSVSAYSFDKEELEAVLGGRLIDFVLIDGPAAEDGARFGTLPLIREFVRPGALVLLDDALRDGELAAARAWHDLGVLETDGIIAVEKGLLVGRMARRAEM